MKPDLSDLQQLKEFLRRHGLWANKGFGQNFLIDASVLQSIVDAAQLDSQDSVIEVGPGPGVLSQRLAPLVNKLVAVEIDEKMISPWKDLMKDFSNVEILQQDVLHFSPPKEDYKVVANIPYYITSPILKHFLRSPAQRPSKIVLMIQKEVAERVVSTKKPTLLSWEVQVFGEPRLVCKVPPESFYPSPKVDSAVLCIDLYDQPLIEEHQLEGLFRLLAFAYKQPRKTLFNNLTNSGRVSKEELTTTLEEVFSGDLKKRPHQLNLEDWKKLLKELPSFL